MQFEFSFRPSTITMLYYNVVLLSLTRTNIIIVNEILLCYWVIK